jgi:hypothetical protein
VGLLLKLGKTKQKTEGQLDFIKATSEKLRCFELKYLFLFYQTTWFPLTLMTGRVANVSFDSAHSQFPINNPIQLNHKFRTHEEPELVASKSVFYPPHPLTKLASVTVAVANIPFN